ncbi:MAG: hypothetical protein L0Y42_08470 [Phycisphaerales bacterium]|nr:hypothetical protein [Phycisphaerales bacterium]
MYGDRNDVLGIVLEDLIRRGKEGKMKWFAVVLAAVVVAVCVAGEEKKGDQWQYAWLIESGDGFCTFVDGTEDWIGGPGAALLARDKGIQRLNRIGGLGWELVCHERLNERPADGHQWHFKRRVPN